MKKTVSLSLIALVAFVLILSSCASKTNQAAKQAAGDEKWIQLFNGKDLNDWQIKFKGEELGVNTTILSELKMACFVFLTKTGRNGTVNSDTFSIKVNSLIIVYGLSIVL